MLPGSIAGDEQNLLFGTVRRLILVYMNADNDLEYQGLFDLNEMEAAASLDNIEVLILIDRNKGYDNSMGNWSGTRLYRLKRDRAGQNYDIVSERLACPELGLEAFGDYDELNLGTSGVLSSFINYGRTEYPAENTILVLWGHGTGWRDRRADSGGGRSGGLQGFLI